MKAVGVAEDTLLAAGGDISDYQQMLKMIDTASIEEYAIDDGASMSASALHQWLTRVMYNRRSKMDPLWNRWVATSLDARAASCGGWREGRWCRERRLARECRGERRRR